MNKIKSELLKALILSFVGYNLYIGIEVTFRQQSYILMGICGALSLILIEKINDLFSWDMPLFWQMIIGGAIITALEGMFGLYSLFVLHVRMWDYSNLWGASPHGLVCPLFSLFWVLLSGVGIIIADAINFYVLHEEPRPYYRCINGKVFWMMPRRICGGD